jgi:hypothetical protein
MNLIHVFQFGCDFLLIVYVILMNILSTNKCVVIVHVLSDTSFYFSALFFCEIQKCL